MKPALISAVVLTCIIHFAPGGEAEKASVNKTGSTQQQPPNPTIVVFNERNDRPKGNGEAAKNQPPNWYKSPEWILVIVGVITARAVGWQSYETRRAVTAANRGIEIQISKDRGRIRVEPGKFPLVGDNQSGKFNAVYCKLMNYGHTEAFIDDSRASLVLVPEKDIRANYANCKQFLYATQSVPAQSLTSYSVMVPLEPSVMLTDDAVMSIKKGESFVHFYGFVNYHTLERNMRVTVHLRWTMQWGGMIEGQIMDWWEPVGPLEENIDVEVKNPIRRWWNLRRTPSGPNG